MKHGTNYAYSRLKCRCSECRGWRRQAAVARRGLDKEQLLNGTLGAGHGTDRRASAGCPCEQCRARAAEKALRQRTSARGRLSESDHDTLTHGTAVTAINGGCRCTECLAYRSEYWSKRNATSRETAYNNGKEWTGPELEVAVRDLPLPEIARMLGRTIAAVQAARKRANAEEPKRRFLLTGAEPETRPAVLPPTPLTP